MADGGGFVLIVDGDADFRGRIARVLARGGLNAAEASGGEQALELPGERPVAAVVDVDLPDVDGFEVCRALRERYGDALPVILVSAERVSPHDRIAGLLIGADDYLAKPVNGDELLARLRRLTARSLAAQERPLTERRNGLSPREVEVLRLLADGHNAAAIAERLVITRKTVASHLQRVMAKLGVHSRAQAVAEAYRLGVVNGDFEGHALDEIEGERLAPPPVTVR